MVDRAVSDKSFECWWETVGVLIGTAFVESAYLCNSDSVSLKVDLTSIYSGGSSTVASLFELGADPQRRQAWLVPFHQAN
jgi:hypothetical protein